MSALAEAPVRTFGRIIEGEKSWLIDAQPFIMGKARALLKSGKHGNRGENTHSMWSVPRTKESAKDLLWFADRFPFSIEPSFRATLETLAARYDRILERAAVGDTDQSLSLSPVALAMAEPARPHQIGFRNLALGVGRLLLADHLGLGKTISAITLLCEPEARPALIVVPTHLCLQWQKQIKRFLPGASVHIIKGTKNYELPNADVIITAYTRLEKWQDVLVPMACHTLIFDEVQDLRHVDTKKRIAARAISEAAQVCVGLSATPIYNLGAEIWSVMDVIAPDALGPQADFNREWATSGGIVSDTLALHGYLVSQGLMLRRTRADIGINADAVNRDVITIEGDLASLTELQDVAKTLALSVLSNRVGESEHSANELDWKLRQATGIAKAKAVARFVHMLVESGEQVVLTGWHRAVYEIWMKELNFCRPVLYTGSETPQRKALSVDQFVKGHSKVFILSNRSGAGLDGLQAVASTVVFGELDWSPQVMEQIIGRLDREGQTKPVNAYFLTIDDGADPFMIEVLGLKQSQSDGIVAGKRSEATILETTVSSDRLRSLAENYLASIGESVPNPEPQTGLHANVATALRMISLPSSSEAEMQEALFAALPKLLPDALIEREVKVGQRSRLDFLVSRGNERIAIECKIGQTGRPAVYAQVRRYAEEANITGCILLAPWSGVSNFIVDEIPVTIVDWAKSKLRGGGA